MFRKLVKECELYMDMMLVTSAQNIADNYMKVTHGWFNTIKKENRPKPLIGAVNADKITSIHKAVDIREYEVLPTSPRESAH